MTKQCSTVGFAFGLGLFILNFMDTFCTLWIVKMEGGYHIELNPVMRLLMEQIGDWWLAPKMVIGFIVAIFITVHWRRHYWFRLASIGLVSVYIVVVLVHILSIVGYNL